MALRPGSRRDPTKAARTSALAAVAWACALFAADPAAAQDTDLRRQILESQRRLEEIRNERERLRREMEDVRIRVRDAASELANVERRLSASRSVLAEVEFQSETLAAEVEETGRELVTAREQLAESRAVLHRRLRQIYKLGPLHTVRVLIGATSIPDLLNRYRYLRLVADFDRSLVERVEELEGRLSRESQDLEMRMSELGRLRETRLAEVARLRSVEAERAAALDEVREREEQTLSRLDQLEADASRVTSLIGDLERRRVEAAARRSATEGRGPETPASMSGGDAGTLDWPLEGELIYRFGRERRPNGLVLRWNGIGIGADPGTPVRAVKSGEVVLAGPFQGYGPTVVVSHGDGFYTLYLYLEDIGVVEGRPVEAGQVVGTVGGRETPEGPHVEFQIRAPTAGGTPQAQDPLRWLRPRGGR